MWPYSSEFIPSPVCATRAGASWGSLIRKKEKGKRKKEKGKSEATLALGLSFGEVQSKGCWRWMDISMWEAEVEALLPISRDGHFEDLNVRDLIGD